MPLPFPEILGFANKAEGTSGSGRFTKRRQGQLHAAKALVNLQVGYYSFIALGCPRSPARGLKCCGVLFNYQLEIRDRLLSQAPLFCASSGGEIPTVGRGRARLRDMLAAASGSSYTAITGTREALVTSAKDVEIERASLPKHARAISPLSHLTQEQCKVFKDLSVIVKREAEQPPETLRPCHRVARHEEVAFVKKLLDHGMGKLIPDEGVPRGQDGRPLVGGWFCVDHRKGKLRLIFDRRPLKTKPNTSWAGFNFLLDPRCHVSS